MRNMKLTKTNRRGFTFLEIMLVVVIIGILAAVVGPNLVGRTGTAKVNSTKSQISNIETALQMYEIEAGSFPSSSDGLAGLVRRPSNFPEEAWPQGGFMSEVPKDGWNRPFEYVYPSSYESVPYEIISAGKDGQIGTEDDITNTDSLSDEAL